MKFTISRESLLQPLQLVSGAIERRHTLPILSNVLIRVSEGELWLTGTDLEVELISSVQLSGSFEEGRTTVPAKKMMDIVRSLPEESIVIVEVTDNRAVLKAGRGKYTLSTLSANDYPNLEDWEGEVEFEIQQKQLKSLIEKTHFSMAQQDVRYYLNGMSLETEEHLIRTVATDGHRLALATLEYDVTHLPARQVIIPRKGVLEIIRLIDDNESLIKVQIGSNHIRVFSKSFIFTSKLVDGRFPDYRRVLPKESDKAVWSQRDSLKGALSRALILTNEKFKGVRLNLQSGMLKVTANNPEQEEAEENLDVDYQGEDLEIGFNVAYLIDVFNVLQSDNVIVNLSDANASALIHAEGDETALYVVMPMRL